MIQTEQQRRWWFATHPEFSFSESRRKTLIYGDDDDEGDRPSPDSVDALMDKLLTQARDDFWVDVFREVKSRYGTEAASKNATERRQLAQGAEAKTGSDDEPEEGSFASAYGWARDNWEDAFNIAVGSLFGPLLGTASVERAIRSLEKQVQIHEQRLADYIKNPEAYDNQGLLNKAPSPEAREKIIQSRISVLRKQISNFKSQIERLRRGLK